MARGVNKVILVGTCGQDPEVRYMPNGNAVTNLSLATSEQWTDKQTGQKVEKTEWHRVSMFGKVAEIAGEYLRKGRPVYVEGRLKTRKWTDKEGRDNYTTEVIAEQMQLLGSREGMGEGSAEASQGGGYRRGGEERATRPSAPRAAPAKSTGAESGFDEMDDDIPF